MYFGKGLRIVKEEKERVSNIQLFEIQQVREEKDVEIVKRH